MFDAFDGKDSGFVSQQTSDLGFGDIVAINLTGRILVTLEVVLGYIMFGGLISVFANKFARRS